MTCRSLGSWHQWGASHPKCLVQKEVFEWIDLLRVVLRPPREFPWLFITMWVLPLSSRPGTWTNKVTYAACTLFSNDFVIIYYHVLIFRNLLSVIISDNCWSEPTKPKYWTYVLIWPLPLIMSKLNITNGSAGIQTLNLEHGLRHMIVEC